MIKLLSLFSALGLTACTPLTVTEYITLEVPVKCAVERPVRPEKNIDPLITLVDVLSYTRKLETALDACIGEAPYENK